jgi:ribose/xylose/arabinose/galactoside ABC-type transport system permease subunit
MSSLRSLSIKFLKVNEVMKLKGAVLDIVSATLAKPGAGALILIVGVCVVMTMTQPSFLTLGNWANIVNQMVYVLILAIGMTVVLITGGIDLSVGSILAVSAAVMASMLNSGQIFILSFLVALGAGAVFGLVNGLLVTKVGVPDFVATLATLGIGAGIMFLWTKGFPIIGYMVDDYSVLAGRDRLFDVIGAPVIVSIVVIALVAVMLRFTSLGRHSYAVGSNRDAARLSGVNVNSVRILAYVLSGVLAALAGILLAGRTTTVSATMGVGYELQAIAAAVIGGAVLGGGRGRVYGAVIGALLLTVTYNVINISGVSATWQQVFLGGILLIAVLIDRIGRAAYERSLTRVRAAVLEA